MGEERGVRRSFIFLFEGDKLQGESGEKGVGTARRGSKQKEKQ